MKLKGLKKRMAIMLILLAGWHISARPGVIVTGILDGTLSGGCPKVIEIFVTGTENLNYYEVWRSLNGAPFGSGSGSISSMSGIFTNTFVYLVKTDHVDAFHDVFGNEGIFANVVPMGIINGNGNDGFQVRLKVGSVVIDQVWLEDATDSYVDSYWYRKHGTGPDGGWIPSAWETPGNDALDGLDMAGLQAAVPFGTYAIMWQGMTADWNDNSNWSTGLAPSSQTNVLVPDSALYFPVITNVPDNPAICKNLTIADTANLIVNPGKAMTVFGNLMLDSLGPEQPDRGLILKSDSSPSPSGSLILKGNPSGTVIAERYMAKDNGWHFLSSPVDTQSLQPEFVPVPIDQSFDLYYWEENSEPSSGWINIRDENGYWNPQFENAFFPGKGYLISYSSANAGDATRIFRGVLNSGDQDIPVAHSENYWNLLGNPYSCALEWSSGGIDKGVIAAGTMYIWDPALNDNQGGYRAHNGTTGVPEGTTSVIPAMQGFFVQSLETGSLSIDVSDDDPLVHGNQPFYKKSKELTEMRIRMKVSKGLFSDETLIYFDPEATNQFDPEFDAEKLFIEQAGSPEIYTLSEPDHSLCINILAENPASVMLGIVYNIEDTLTLAGFDFEGISAETGIFLEDKLLNVLVNIREQPEYRFYHNTFQSENRFTVHFMNVASQAEILINNEPDFWCSGNSVYVTNPTNRKGVFHLYSLDGRLMEKIEITGGNQVIHLTAPTGLYILRITASRSASGRKIFIY